MKIVERKIAVKSDRMADKAPNKSGHSKKEAPKAKKKPAAKKPAKPRESGAQKRTRMGKERVLKALEASLGIVTTACKEADVTRASFYDWKEKDPEFSKAVDDIEDVALDFAESMLLQNIKGKKETSIIFYLKTKGKKRGYIERQEVTGADGDTLVKQYYVLPDGTKLEF